MKVYLLFGEMKTNKNKYLMRTTSPRAKGSIKKIKFNAAKLFLRGEL